MTPTERALIEAIRNDPDDTASVAVYADWLEENGFPSRAKFIRNPSSEHALPEDVEWRAIVSHAPIASCTEPVCSKRWSAMHETLDDPLLRFCERCTKHVQYCTSVAEVIEATGRGSEVARDASLSIHDARRALKGPAYVPLPANPPAPRGYRAPGQPTVQRNVLTRLFGLFRRR